MKHHCIFDITFLLLNQVLIASIYELFKLWQLLEHTRIEHRMLRVYLVHLQLQIEPCLLDQSVVVFDLCDFR